MSVRWVRPPSELEKAIDEYADRVLTAVTAVAARSAWTMQNAARRNARWTDRTGNARGGLFGVAVREGEVITITLGHTMYYGLYLELANGQKYAIIMTTIEAHLPDLERMLRDLLRG